MNRTLSFLDQAVNTDYPRNHLVHQYSAEGFKELFFKVRKALTNKDEHGVKPGDVKPGEKIKNNDEWTPAGKAAVAELKAALNKYYLNDHWLNAQKLVEGEVNAGDFSKVFEVDGKVNDPFKNIETSVQRIVQYANKIKPSLKQVHDRVLQLDKQLARETKGAELDDQAAIDKVKAVIKQFEELAKFATKVPKFGGTVLGNTTLITKEQHGYTGFASVVTKDPKGVDKLPALDREGIKKAARLIQQCYDYDNPLVPDLFDFRWLDHSDGSDFNEWIYDADNDVYMDYYDVFYYQGADQLWVYPFMALIDTHALASALERWIDRSIV